MCYTADPCSALKRLTCVMEPYTPSSSSTFSTAMERRGTQNTLNSCCAAAAAAAAPDLHAAHTSVTHMQPAAVLNMVRKLRYWAAHDLA